MAQSDFMLTTLDNPYNPFTQFDLWSDYDVYMGYNTCSLLARVVRTSNELSEQDQDFAVAEGCRTILEMNLTGNYRLVDKFFDPYVLQDSDLEPEVAPDLWNEGVDYSSESDEN